MFASGRYNDTSKDMGSYWQSVPRPVGSTCVIPFRPHTSLSWWDDDSLRAPEEAEAQTGSICYARSHCWCQSQNSSLVLPAPPPTPARPGAGTRRHRSLTVSWCSSHTCHGWEKLRLLQMKKKKISPNSSISRGSAQSRRNCKTNGLEHALCGTQEWLLSLLGQSPAPATPSPLFFPIYTSTQDSRLPLEGHHQALWPQVGCSESSEPFQELE